MIRYNSNSQMTIEEFKTPFQVKLDKENRWIRLGDSLPWAIKQPPGPVRQCHYTMVHYNILIRNHRGNDEFPDLSLYIFSTPIPSGDLAELSIVK